MDSVSNTVNASMRTSRKFLHQAVSDLCWPAFSYLIIAAFVFLTGIAQRGVTETIVLVVAMALMTWLLNTLCKENKVGLSWAVLIAILSGVVVFRYAALLVGVIAVL